MVFVVPVVALALYGSLMLMVQLQSTVVSSSPPSIRTTRTWRIGSKFEKADATNDKEHAMLSSTTVTNHDSADGVSYRTRQWRDRKAPKPLSSSLMINQHATVKAPSDSILLVHVGKAGGTSIRHFLKKARNACEASLASLSSAGDGDGDDNGGPVEINITGDEDSIIDVVQTCAVAQVTGYRSLIHLNRNHNTATNYSHFLVPVRNPVDRLISWFNYERSFLTNPDDKRTSQRLIELVGCYANVNELFADGLPSVMPKDDIRSSSSSNVSSKISNQTRCQRLALSCVTGEYPCYAHNFYNYEVYLEDMLFWRGAAESSSSLSASDMSHQPTINIDGPRDVRIDVLRVEHTQSDLNQIIELWTGKSPGQMMRTYYKPLNTREDDSSNPHHHADASSASNSKDVTPDGLKKLCRAICSELVIYKTILFHSDNLNDEEVEESFRELDGRCGLDVDKECGVKYYYRGVKHVKFDRVCDPYGGGKSRSLFAIAGDHPSC